MSSPFTLLSWNLLANVHITPGWYPLCDPAYLRSALREEHVLDQLAAFDADVMALQEVSPQLLPALRARFPAHGLAFVSRAGEGLAVMVRDHRPWSQVVPMPGRTNRAMLVVLPGGLRLANVHLKWSGPPKPGQDRPGVSQLAAVMGYQPDFIVGDFNAFPEWPERTLACAQGWRDVGPKGPTCNVHAWLQPLDAVLARGSWSVKAQDLQVIQANTPMPSRAMPSDHLPLLVRFS